MAPEEGTFGDNMIAVPWSIVLLFPVWKKNLDQLGGWGVYMIDFSRYVLATPIILYTFWIQFHEDEGQLVD